jgi:signal transduction histidine kinase
MASWQDDADDGSAPVRPGDVVLAGAVAVVLSVVILMSQLGSGARPDVMAYVFALGFGAVLLLHRTTPVAVLVLSILGTFAYYALGYPPIGVALPVVAALYCAAESGLTRWAVGGGILVMSVSMYFRLRDDPQPVGFVLGTDSVTNLGLITAAIALGYGVRARRLRISQQARITRLTTAQHEREAQLRVQNERGQISRELHDTVGHMLTVISLHANVGREALGRDDAAVARALDDVADHSGRALKELRTMVGVLRSGQDAPRQVRSIEDMDTVLESARTAGLDLTVDISVRPQDLTAAVDAAVHRIVQESLTNVIRHAGAAAVQVSVVRENGQVHVRVMDDGEGAPAGSGPGYGLTGMAERARLLGGTLSSTTLPDGGHLVHAVLPEGAPS